MAAGGGDFQGSLGVALTPNIGQVWGIKGSNPVYNE
jgi:hypothetical protein